MIEKLTKEQEDLLDVYKDKWLETGLSTKEIDFDKSIEALKVIYAGGNEKLPSRHEIYDSPFAARTAWKEKYNLDIHSNDFIYGAQDATWLSFYNYFLEVLDVKQCEPLKGLMDLASHCGWALIYDEVIALTHNPVHIKFDDEERLHCENDLAIKYRDNTGVAAWHGTPIPKEWIFDKNVITPEIMFRWENIEQRRAACEIIGWANVLDHLEAVVIDEDADPTIGTLLEVNLPDSGKEKFLIAHDPNVKKRVGIPVPKEMTTALEANSWTYGIDKVEFNPQFRV